MLFYKNRKGRFYIMKKKLSVAVLLIMLFTAAVFSNTSAASFSDIDSSKYKEAIVTLSNLKVIDGYEDGTFKPDGTITRAEFTKMLVCVMGFGENAHYGTPAFTDIDMWAKNYICTAYGLGIVDGMSDYEFAPDSPVTYEQAQKMMVCALGYGQNAVDKGGWPNGYIGIAGELRLKDSISGVSNSDPAPRGAIAQLMYNSLEVEMKEFKNAQWESTEKTLLKDYLNVVKLKGTLVGVEDYITNECTKKLGNYQMDIMDNSGEEVLINFRDYTQNVTDINKYIGNIITVYYNLDILSDNKTLVAIDSETVKNDEVTVNYADIISFDGSTFSYYDSSDKKKNIKINMNTVSIRYNGKPVKDDSVTLDNENYSLEDAVTEWLSPDSDNFIYGDVKLTDSGSDGVIDLIQIYNYQTMVAYQAPKSSDYKITDKLISGNYLILDPNSPDYSYTIQKNGAMIEVTSVAAGDIISYAKSLDGSLYTVYVTSKPVTGTITTTEDGYIYVEKTRYKKGDMCDEYISKNQSGRTLKVGVSGTFYTDMYGTIIYGTISSATESLPYAYIANAVVEPGEDAGYVTIYTSGTAAKTYKMKNRVKVNGKSVNYDEAVDLLAESSAYNNDDTKGDWASAIYGEDAPTTTPYSQVARINLSDNEIASIVTLDSELKGVQNESTDTIVKYTDLTQCVFTSSSSSTTKKGNFKLASGSTSTTAFSTDDSTTVIYVAKDRTEKTAYASKGFTNNTRYYVEAYDMKASKIAGLVLVYSNTDNTITSVSKDTPFGIVSKLPEDSYNSSTGETSQKITVFYGPNNSAQTTEKAWQTYSNTEFSDVAIGDVVQFAYDTSNRAKGRINNIKYSDIADVLSGSVKNNDKLYDWNIEQEPAKENNYQPLKFDYRFKYYDVNANKYFDEMHVTGSVSYIYSRACMYNISQVFEDDKKIYVTKNGFDSDGNLDDGDYEEIEITSSTKFLRMEENQKGLSKYAIDTTTDLSITDLKSAQYFGKDCSKVLVCSSKGVARLIIIYN